MIDDIGDPDQGKNGYPLLSSCERVVRAVWGGIAFDQIDLNAQVLRTRVQRYPARPVFLVSKIEQMTSTGTKKSGEADKDEKVKEVSVAPDKQSALLVEGSPVLTAPLWEPKGGSVKCPVLIDTEGKIAQLETGAQLCEAVQWSTFRYQPPVQAGHPVKVRTDVEVRFEPRK